MDQRTMLKISVSEERIALWTVSRGFRSPHRFILLEKDLRELEEKKYLVAADIRSFVVLRLVMGAEGQGADILEARFSWLSAAGDNRLSGTGEVLRFFWQAIQDGIEKSRGLNGAAAGVLSIGGYRNPKIEFQSRENLKAVAEKRILRKKLGKFLSCHFEWKGSSRITVFDDFEPYSFFFREERPSGTGICGGIILHDRENLAKAYYAIHT